VGAYEKEGKPVTIPVYGEVSGPPTLFGREMFPELLALSGDEGGRKVVRTDPARVARVVIPTEDMPPDIDTPEDYERYMNRAAP
jgi:molybdenum cofactor cytidylyltransferase